MTSSFFLVSLTITAVQSGHVRESRFQFSVTPRIMAYRNQTAAVTFVSQVSETAPLDHTVDT